MSRIIEPQRFAGEKDKEKDRPNGEMENSLLESRQILAQGPVNDDMYRAVCSSLLFLENKDPDKEITVVLNSPGGSADSGFGIYDMMKFISCPVKVLCAGLCASAGVLIFVGADPDKRVSLPNSRFMLHQPSTQAYGQASDMEITAREILRTRQRYAAVVAAEIKGDPEIIIKDSNRDFWLNPGEAKEYGLVTSIVTSRKDM